MTLSKYSIFREEKMKEKILEKNPKAYHYVYGNYRQDIIEISEKYDRDKIEESITSEFTGKIGTVLSKNLNYLMDGMEIIERSTSSNDGKDKDDIEIDNFKKLTIGELLNMNFKVTDGYFNISLEELSNKIEEKNRKDIWGESTVEETIADKFLIEDKMNVKLINSLSDYTEFIYGLESRMPHSLVSRGQKDCSFDLVPSIYRIHQKRQDVHAKGYEQTFRQRIAHYSEYSTERSIEELRAEGQHYGLPTEYLDFTEAHIVSLLFATEEYTYKENHSIVFFIDSATFNKVSINKEEKLINLQIKSEKEYLKDYSSCSYFIKVPNIDERIHFQRGCFLRISQQDYQDNKDFIENLKDKCGIAIINRDFKEDILKELFSLGVTFESIYPDKDNLVKSIKFNYDVMQGGGKMR